MLNLIQTVKYKIVDSDEKIIISTNCLQGVDSILSYSLIITEDVNNFFIKTFRYSQNFGISYSDFIDLDLTNLNAIIFDEVYFTIFEIHLIKRGNPVFNDFLLNLTFKPLSLELNFLENTYLDFQTDYSIVIDLTASLVRKVNFSILPKFVERTNDFIDIFYSVCLFLSLIKRYALKIRKYDEYEDFLNLYLNQNGLFTCKNQSLNELTELKESLFNEFRRRGSLIPFLNKENLNEVNDGEVLRMICYEECDEFIIDDTKPEQFGWNLSNSSPLNRHLYNHNSTNKSYEKYNRNIVDLSKYPLINPSNCSIESTLTESYLKVVSNGGIGSLVFVKNKSIVVDSNIDYEISFLIKVSNISDSISFKVSSFNCLGEFIELRDITCFNEIGNSDNFNNSFLDNQNLSIANKWILIRGIIFRKWLSQDESYLLNKQLNINKGNNLRFSDNVSRIIPQITLESGNEIFIKDLRIQPLKTIYSQGFIQANNWINFWIKDNNSNFNRRQTVFIGIDPTCELVGENHPVIVKNNVFDKDIINSLFGFSNTVYQNIRKFFVDYNNNFWINFLGDFRQISFNNCLRPKTFIGIDEYCQTRPQGFIGIDDYCELYQDGLEFDGVNDYVAVDTGISGDFSISFIIKPEITIDTYLFHTYNQSFGIPFIENEMFYCYFGVNKLFFIYRLSSSPNIENVSYIDLPTDGELIQITYTMSGLNPGDTKIYINSIESRVDVGSTILGSFINTDKLVLNCVNYYGYNYFNGSPFFDFKIFNQALSQIEVDQLYNSRGDANPSCLITPIFELNFNEKSGFIANENISANNANLINFILSDVEENSPTSKWIRNIIK